MKALLQHLKLLMRNAVNHREGRHYADLDNGYGMRVFVKAYPTHVKKEFRRGQDIYETSIQSGAFRAPRPIALVESHNIIIWEYLEDLIPIRKYLVRHLLREPNQSTRVLHDCGCLLGLVHRRWAPTGNGDYSRFLPEIHSPSLALNRHVQSTLQESCCQWVHGDFGCANLFVQEHPEKRPSVTVIDACLNRFVFGDDRPDLVAPSYVDVSHFVFSLQNRSGFNNHARKRVPTWIEDFLGGYEETTGQQLDRATVFACAAEMLQGYQECANKNAGRRTFQARMDQRFRLRCLRQLYNTAASHLPSTLTELIHQR